MLKQTQQIKERLKIAVKKKQRKLATPFYQSWVGIFFVNLMSNDLQNRAQVVAFNLTLACFPSILALFTLVPYMPVRNFDLTLLAILHELLPETVYLFAEKGILDFIQNPRIDLLSVGFIFAFHTTADGILAITNAFDRRYKDFQRRKMINRRLLAYIFTIYLGLCVFACVMLLIAEKSLLKVLIDIHVINLNYLYYILFILRTVTLGIVIFGFISVIYFLGPSVKQKMRFVAPSALITTILCLSVSLGFSYYFNNFGNLDKLYGSIGTLIGLMLWFWALSIILLIGFEITASLEELSRKRKNFHLNPSLEFPH